MGEADLVGESLRVGRGGLDGGGGGDYSLGAPAYVTLRGATTGRGFTEAGSLRLDHFDLQTPEHGGDGQEAA